MSEALPPAQLDAAVLVINWNTRALLAECLQAVLDNTADRLTVQTVVVDNASHDGSADMVRTRFPQVTLLALADNVGFVGGNNRAYAAAGPARYVLLLNPDAILAPGALYAMVAWMDAHSKTGACGPLTLNPDGTLQPSWTRFPTVWSEIRGHHERRFPGSVQPAALTADALRALPDALPADWVSGACLLLRRDALARDLHNVLFDPDFHMYSEETDLCYRLHRAGWPTVFLSQAEVVHHYGQSSKQAPARTLRLLYRSKFLFFAKHYGPGRTGLLKAGVGVTSGLKWLAFTLLSLPPSPRRTQMTAQRARQRAVLQAVFSPAAYKSPHQSV